MNEGVRGGADDNWASSNRRVSFWRLSSFESQPQSDDQV